MTKMEASIQSELPAGRKESETEMTMMKIETLRFGEIEIPEEEIVSFPNGIIGFPQDKRFILIPHENSEVVAWLQCVEEPSLAFPAVSAHALAPEYPDVSVMKAANKIGLEGEEDDFAILVVLTAPRHQPATLNLLAPIVIQATTRVGAQLFLDGSKFTTRELFILPTLKKPTPQVAPEAEAAAG